MNSQPPAHSFPPSSFARHTPSPIQLPMLGPLQGMPPSHGQQGPQQQQQQPQQQQQGPQNNGIPPPPPQSGQDFTLSSVLHFLQTEWRRYERDRNEWEIERAEMRARIALLEGERRSFDNVKLDLMRRIKMLEYALRMERSKQLTQPTASSIPPSKFASLQTHSAGGSLKDETGSHKEGSGGSSPRSEDSPLPAESRIANGISDRAPNGRPMTWAGGHWSMSNGPIPNAVVGKPPPGRDPKSRVRSRDYLKQCLQEVSYLTSPQAMNPLPNRPLLANNSLPLSLPNVPSFEQMGMNARPRKVMPEVNKDFPLLNGMNIMSGPPSAPASSGPQIPLLERSNPLGGGILQPQGLPQHPQQTNGQQGPALSAVQPLQQQQQPSQQPEAQKDGTDGERRPEPQQLTAIFRPDDAGEWKERLRLAHEESERARLQGEAQAGPSSLSVSWGEDSRLDDDEKEEEAEAEDEDSNVVGEGEGTKVWKAKRTLRNHLDAVRAIAFHPTELCLATGGDDCTVKIWRMNVNDLTSAVARPTTEVEPQLTLRGHSAAITRLIHAPSKGLLYSASLDSSIRVWALPSPSHTTYAPYDHTRARGELIGHTDAVWDLALVRDESTLISCGAEGSVKVWDVSGPSGGGSLMLTWGYNGLESEANLEEDSDAPGATAVEAIKVDLKKVAVAYQTSVIKIFDIQTGKELSRIQGADNQEPSPITQINSLASHPTMPLLVTAHEDKYIRIFDILTGQCTHSMLAHLDGATSLSIDAAGFSLVSGSHDCSVRFWDLLGNKTCVQEITSHREKAREGVLDVQFHPSLPIMASAGSDGVVKLYG